MTRRHAVVTMGSRAPSTARSASGWMRVSRKVPGRSPDRWNSVLNRVTQPITSSATAMT